MKGTKAFKVITANHLILGDVIYLDPWGAWVRDLQSAQIFDAAEHAQSRFASAQKQTDVAVGVYLADVHFNDGEIQPAHFREAFRAIGPSNYYHGKQELADHV